MSLTEWRQKMLFQLTDNTSVPAGIHERVDGRISVYSVRLHARRAHREITAALPASPLRGSHLQTQSVLRAEPSGASTHSSPEPAFHCHTGIN